MVAPAMAGCRIEVRQVSKTYRLASGNEVLALAGISFDVGAGEFVSIVGPSGCGKSTLLSIIGGLSSASQGEVLVNSSPVHQPRRDVGFVFQDPVLLPWRSVLQNAMLGIEVLGLDQARYRARALELIDLVGLSGFERALPRELSGGMQQRNAIVRALLHEPNLLLMDEPFGALDAMTRDLLHDEVERIWRDAGLTVLFVTHNVREAVRLGDRVVLLSSRPGHVIAEFPVDIERPRRIDSPAVATLAATITDQLRAEVTRHGGT